jgi:ABC-type dipeptide/oligopeptide/nickel transport system permease component
MLAEDIGGWLVAGAFLVGALGTSILALGALVPAWRGNWPLTLALIAPAIVMFLLASCWIGQMYFQRDHHDHDEIIENYVQPWFMMAFPPLITALLAGSVLWFKRRKRA